MLIRILHLYKSQQGTIPELTPASLRERVFAQLIDGVLLGILSSIYYYLASQGTIYTLWISPIFPLYLLQPQEGLVPNPSDWWWGGYFLRIDLPLLAEVQVAIPSLILIVLYGSYYIIFHFYYGQTPGKMVKGLVVLNNDRQGLTLRQSLQRWLYSLISLLPLGAGFWVSSGKSAQMTWHDQRAGTQVWKYVEW
jgi:uncharacterized RDD family membrane protein YckC